MTIEYKKIIASVTLIFLLSIDNVFAEEVMTWAGCVKEAKFNNPDLASAKEKINENRAAKEITRSAYLPQIDTNFSEATEWQNQSGSLANTGSTSAPGGSGTTKATTYTYGITGQQMLFDGFKTSYDLSADERNITASRYYYEVTSSDVRLNLKTAFSNLLDAQELINVTEGILKRRKQSYELVKLRYESGLEHRGSLMKSAADVAEAEYELEQARRNIYSAQVMLIRYIGRAKFTSYDIIANGDFTVNDKQIVRPDFEKMADTNPLLRQLVAKKESAKYGYKSANADFFPQIFANGSASKSDTVWPPKASTWSVGTSASFAIFDGGQKFANVAQSLATWKQTQADERAGKDGVILTMANTWASLQDAIANVSVQKKYLEAAQERAKIAEAEYSIGLLTYDSWTIIEDNYVSAKKSYLSAQTSALIAEATWIQAKGGTLDYE